MHAVSILTRAIFCLLLSSVFYQCNDNHATVVTTPRDTTIHPANALTDLYLDSTIVENFIAAKNLDDSTATLIRNFYNNRNFQYAWFTDGVLAQQAKAFWNLHDNYLQYSRDSSIYDSSLSNNMGRLIVDDTTLHLDRLQMQETELSLTRHFFVYARFAYNGKIDPESLQWYIPRKKVNALSLLDSLIARKGANIEDWEPINPQYTRIKEYLAKYSVIEKNKHWQIIDLGNTKAFRLNAKNPAISKIKMNLHATSDFASDDTTAVFTPALKDAVILFQKRFGLKPDGVIGKNMLQEMNVPIEKRIEQMLVNMERMRWFPQQTKGDFILVNIPEFKFHMFEDFKKIFDIDIVVGKSSTGTVIFTDSLKYIVFSPYWNVPASIVKNEIAPAMATNSNYLDRHNMEITAYSNGLPVIRQKPGGSNALGLVKFIFPNHYNIYFHDTPSKSLFEQENRAFSHGCIRLKEPVKLAEYLLRDQPEWTPEKMDEAMHLDKEKWVSIRKPLPVFITYFTTWVDATGALQFRKDVYGHDQEMAERLFKK